MNALITPEVITREALRLLENEFVAAKTVSRAHEGDFEKIGQDLFVRKPVRFVTNTGADVSGNIQNVEEAYQKVRVRTQENVAWKFSSRDMTLTIEQYSERYIKPAISALCHEIEASIHQQYKKAFHSAVPAAGIGNDPASFIDLGGCRTLLSDHAAPYGERSTLLSTDACLNLANEVAGFQNAYSSDRKSAVAQEEATIGKFVGFSNMESQFVIRHTAGVLDGTVLIDGTTTGTTYAAATSQSDPDLYWTQTIHVDAAGSNVTDWAVEGDVLTIDNCYSVNPASKQSTGKLQHFVVRQNADTSGNETDLIISPPIITSGPHQTVEFASGVSDLDNEGVTFISTGGQVTSQNLAYHREAITFGMVPLEMPDAVVWGNTQSENGMSMRVYKWMDGSADEEYIRLDAMWFVETVHHDLIARLWGS